MRERIYADQALSIYYTMDENPVDVTFSMHTHFKAELYYLISGDGVFHVEGTQYPLQAGDILLMRPSEAHYVALSSTKPYARMVISFDMNLFDGIEGDQNFLRAFTDRESGKGNLYRRSDFENWNCDNYIDIMRKHPGNRMAAIGALTMLLSAVNSVFDTALPAHAEKNTIEVDILRYINAHLSEELSLDTLAQRYFISRAQLCRRFKKVTGTSMGKYITAKRMIAAQNMLLSGKKPSEVYIHCGFEDYSTFYRSYVRYYGHSPKDLRFDLEESGAEHYHFIDQT